MERLVKKTHIVHASWVPKAKLGHTNRVHHTKCVHHQGELSLYIYLCVVSILKGKVREKNPCSACIMGPKGEARTHKVRASSTPNNFGRLFYELGLVRSPK